ncbi:MAG: hypothetical protein ABSF09_07930 [Candidatus Bathyarchaeia archaeon]|jgi:hypothetical protein
MIGVGTLIDYNMLVHYPRREYVGLRRSSLPETLDLFMQELGTAVFLGEERQWERYGYHRDYLELQVQRHAAILAKLKIDVRSKWKIKSWNSSEGNHLYLLMLQWRFLEHGKVAEYYDRLDKPPADEQKIEKILFSERIKGLKKSADVQRAAAYKMPLYESPVERMQKRIKAERLRTPIATAR